MLRTVLFAPEDLALVKGDPGERRRFLDDLLVAMAPRYAAVRADYERVLKQRTALLKSAGRRAAPRATGSPGRRSPPPSTSGTRTWPGPGPSSWSPASTWSTRSARTSRRLPGGGGDGGDPAAIAYRRSSRPGRSGAREPATPACTEADCGHRPRSRARGPGARGREIARAALEVRSSELDRGVCLAGPHRDELELSIRALPARGYASHGESWSLALALRLASFDLLRPGREDPVLILDDVFAELDAGRRERLATLVATAEQVLVTAAVPADVPAILTGARFTVRPAG